MSLIIGMNSMNVNLLEEKKNYARILNTGVNMSPLVLC